MNGGITDFLAQSMMLKPDPHHKKAQQLGNLSKLEYLDTHCKHQNENFPVNPASSDIHLIAMKPVLLCHTNPGSCDTQMQVQK